MIIEVLAGGPFAMNVYLVGSEGTGDAVLIDPGYESERLLARAQEKGLKVGAVLCTHGHIDHVAEAAACRRATGAPLCLHRDDRFLIDELAAHAALFGLPRPAPPTIDRFLADGETVTVGDLSFRVLHVPGHTPGHVAFVVGGRAWVGDCLFRDSIGRTDLPGGDAGTLLASIRDRLLPLGDEVVAYPGHGPETTMGYERRNNPFLNE